MRFAFSTPPTVKNKIGSHTPRYRIDMRADECGFPRINALGNSVNREVTQPLVGRRKLYSGCHKY